MNSPTTTRPTHWGGGARLGFLLIWGITCKVDRGRMGFFGISRWKDRRKIADHVGEKRGGASSSTTLLLCDLGRIDCLDGRTTPTRGAADSCNMLPALN